MKQDLKQMAGQPVRPATPANDRAPVLPPRAAGLPGADRRILRKRLAAPARAGAPETPAVRTGAR
jgi:hypothetical protein